MGPHSHGLQQMLKRRARTSDQGQRSPSESTNTPRPPQVTPRSRETRGELGQKMGCSLSRQKLPPRDTVSGNAGKGGDVADRLGPRGARTGQPGCQGCATREPDASALAIRAAAAFGSDSTRYRSQEEGSVSSLLPEAPNSPVRGLTQHYL